MWVMWWGLVPGGITSEAPLQYPQCTGVRPHQAGGEIFDVALWRPRLYWTHMLMEQTQGWEKDPQAKATWLYTTFASTQHFLQERWDRASKLHSHVPNTSEPAKTHKSGRQMSANTLLFLFIVLKAWWTLFLAPKKVSWPVSQTNFSRVRVSFR